MKAKTPILICLALVLSVLLAYALREQNITNGKVTMSDEATLVPQKIVGMYMHRLEMRVCWDQ